MIIIFEWMILNLDENQINCDIINARIIKTQHEDFKWFQEKL